MEYHKFTVTKSRHNTCLKKEANADTSGKTAKGGTMKDDAILSWQKLIAAPENEEIFRRYRRYANEPRALFEAIGEDLGNPRQEVRAQAFWALTIATPELTNILYQ